MGKINLKIILVLLMVFSIIPGVFAYKVLSDDLVSYYSYDVDFRDDHGVNNASGYSPAQTTGILSNGYNYSSTDYSVTNLDLDSNTFTWNVWLKSEEALGFRGIMGDLKTTSGVFGGSLVKTDDSANGYAAVIAFNSEKTDSRTITGTTTQINDGEWHMITYTYDGTYMRLYTDGVLDGTSEGMPIGHTNIDIELGRDPDQQDRYCSGIYDEIGIWNETLNQTQITLLYNSGNALAYEYFDSVPTAPSGSTLNSADQVGEELTATGAGATDPDNYPGLGITYYYEFRCDSAVGDIIQAKSTDNSWVINSSCAYGHDVYVNIWANDTIHESETYETEIKTIVNTVPTVPSGSTLNDADQIGENLIATGAGSTDADGSDITYYYEFRCDAVDGDLLQAQSTNNSFIITNELIVCDYVYVNIWGNDGTNYSSTYETEIVEFIFVVTNISDYTVITDNSRIQINYTRTDTPVICGIQLNSSSVSCPNQTTSGGEAIITCTVDNVDSENVTFEPFCEDNESSRIYSADNISIRVDDVSPIITINSPNVDNSSIYYNGSIVYFDFNMNDAGNIFGYNITCLGSGGDVEYSVQEIGLDGISINKTINTTFPILGNKQCTLTVSDDHTAKEWNTKVNEKKPWFGIGNHKLDINNEDIIIEYDKSNIIKLEDLYFEEDYDRVKPIFKFKDDSIDKDIEITYTIKFKGNIYSRDSEYAGHVVICPDNNFNNCYWYDAEDDSDTFVDYIIDENKNEIKYIHRLKNNNYNKELKTKSLGGLNLDSETFNITIVHGQGVNFYAYNIYNSTSIDSFNLSIDNGSTVEEYYTTNGTLYVEFDNTSLDFIFSSDDFYNFYQFSSLGANLSSEYNFSMWETELTLNVLNRQSDLFVIGTTINLTNDDYNNISNNNPQTYYLNKGTYNINVSGIAAVENNTEYTMDDINEYEYDIYVDSNLTIMIMDEFTEGEYNLSSPDDITQYIYCEDGSVYREDVTNNSYNFILPCDFEKIKYVVTYPTDRYYRTLLPRSFNITEGNVTVWLVDIDTTQIVFNTFELYSLIEEYDNLNIYFKKNIGDNEYVITSDFLDFEQKIGTYLILGEEYTVEVSATNYPTTNLGFYSADAAGEKIIKLFELTINQDDLVDWLGDVWNVETDNTTDPNRLKVTYDSEDVDVVELSVYNETEEGTLMYTTSVYTDSGFIYYTPPIQYENLTYAIKLNITKEDNATTNDRVLRTQWRSNTNIDLDIIGLGYISTTFMGFFIAIFMGAVALIFTWQTADIGGIVFIGLGGLFIYFGWIYIASITFGLCIIIVIVNFLKNKDRGIR